MATDVVGRIPQGPEALPPALALAQSLEPTPDCWKWVGSPRGQKPFPQPWPWPYPWRLPLAAGSGTDPPGARSPSPSLGLGPIPGGYPCLLEVGRIPQGPEALPPALALALSLEGTSGCLNWDGSPMGQKTFLPREAKTSPPIPFQKKKKEP